MPTAVPLTGDVRIDALSWGFKIDTNNWTYRFPQFVQEYAGYNAIEGFQPFNATQQQQLLFALSNVSTFLPISLTPVGPGFDPTFRFAQASRIDYPDGQGLHVPGGVGSGEAIPPDPTQFQNYSFGDNWFTLGKYESPQFGNFQNAAGIWHEFGHALGLKHGHQTQTVNGAFHPALPTSKDSQNYSVMTYKVYAGDDPSKFEANDLPSQDVDYPWAYQQYDILTLQHLYGANFGPTSNNANTQYQFNPTTGELTIVNNFDTAPDVIQTGGSLRAKIFLTLWDGGGFDVYDFRNYSNDMEIDLRPGNWSTFSTAQLARLGKNIFAEGNLANALQFQGDPRSLIEAAWGGSGNDSIIGNQARNQLAGYNGNDTLNGMGGADDLYGMAGNDIMYVDNVGDQVFENANEGTDRVLASTSYTLTANSHVELLTTTSSTGKSAINLTGNTLKQEIIGNAGANVIGDGGGSGADTLRGLSGNDIYRIGNTNTKIIETSAQGSADRVTAMVSYVLGPGVYVETLTTTLSTGTTAINLTGNALHQEIVGNSGVNILRDGSGMADLLRGLSGSDTYQIYTSGTTIVESSGQGAADRVMAAVDYKLGTGVYVEVMSTTSSTGTTGVDLTGNILKQEIIGNAGANILNDGGVGAADILRGLSGNDTYIVYNAGDVIEEGSSQGTSDRVSAGVDYKLGAGVYIELLTTTSSSGTSSIDLTGNEQRQEIVGNAGSNKIDGKGGSDLLRGGAGKDFFTFSTALGASNVDTISDFNAAADTIRLENAIFTALTATGPLAASAFWASTAGVAHDSNDRIIYDTDTGRLFYDANGSAAGGSIHFATLTGHPTITAADFLII
ncbi:M10 family metallopeptidase C-terminal domain-containing protein [Mesorhizobium sp. ASY16-5R]|uniref:M10 family metallopeptidase C-terminal domain-containing protein n=1 Tax=Mesorhizobium sp. ASY16-5R TaxID=3445772 RepID=UPI003FA19009